ncbi:MAG: hypothetical protein ACJ788_28235 [Ktedonobacteraceae bacterium]
MLYIQFIASLKKRFSRKHTSIEQLDDIQKQQSVEEQVLTKLDPIEQELLAQRGFTSEEVLALFWLRHRYQHGGSDRLIIVRRLEFLRHLVMNGTLER